MAKIQKKMSKIQKNEVTEMKQTNDTVNRQNEFDLMRWCKYEN